MMNNPSAWVRTKADEYALTLGYTFDAARGRKAVDFIQKHCTYPDGELYGQRVQLADWQIEVLMQFYGWVRPDGGTRYRTLLLEIARGAGKTAFGAWIATYELFGRSGKGRKLYSIAGDVKQAKICFDSVRNTILCNPLLRRNARTYRREVHVARTNSTYEVLSADANRQQGLRPDVVLFDETHVQRNRDLWDAMVFGLSKKPNALLISMTTPGSDRTSIAYELHQQGRAILDGTSLDLTVLPVLYNVPETADWTDESNWALGNPNLGVTVSVESLRVECAKAMRIPAYQSNFRRFGLSQWVDVQTVWIPSHEWAACAADYAPDDLDGCECYGGLDLSLCRDLSALVLFFPESGRVLPWFWLPKDELPDRAKDDNVPYVTWNQSGALQTTPGRTIDQETILTTLAALNKKYRIKQIGIDRNRAHVVINKLEDLGMDGVIINQAKYAFDSPTRLLEKMVLDRQIQHPNHPILNWCLANVVVHPDSGGNIKPEKEYPSSRKRIDGVIALVQALECYQRNRGVRTDNWFNIPDNFRSLAGI